MKQGLLNKKIPTLFALVLLIGGIGLSIFFLNNTTSFVGQASVQEEPKNIRISNITDTSFDVTYTTDGNVIGAISYGTSKTSLPDIATNEKSTKTHQINVQNLTPNTTYYFTITSGTNEYSDSGNPYTVTTGPTLPKPTEKKQISGVILNTDGTNADSVLVYVTTSGANTISTVTSSLGSFEIDASYLRSSDLSSYFTLSPTQTLNLIGVTSGQETSAVFLLSESDPLPPLTLSQTYNFTSTAQTTTPQGGSVSFPVLSSEENQEVSITSPSSNEGFSDDQPEFDGTALPGAEVEIIIQSNHEIQTVVQADSNGNWSFRPTQAIEPGEHTITVRSRDENGILRILTRQFTVYAEGSQFTEPSVSPSAPTITPTKTIAPTLTPTVTASPSPTIIAKGGGLVTTPTITPSPTVITPTVTPRPTVTPTGSNSSSILAIMSIGIFLTGMFVVALTKIKSL